jgi:hypothetical protein
VRHDTSGEEDCRDGRCGELLRRGALEDHTPPENLVRRV